MGLSLFAAPMLAWPHDNRHRRLAGRPHLARGQGAFRAGALVVVPVGAAAKAHGPHLPLKTDALTAHALAQRLIERLPAVAAPVVGFGFYPAFTPFAGSQHLSAATFKALLAELLGNLRSHGVRRLVVLNTGVSTEKPIDEVAGGAADLLVLHMRGLGAAAEKLLPSPKAATPTSARRR